MIAAGFKPKRNVFLLYVPDEEMSGAKGMQKFVKHPRLAELNAGLALDEGLASADDKYTVRYTVEVRVRTVRSRRGTTPFPFPQIFYGERKIWWIHVVAKGNVGHGSRFIQGTAVEKLVRAMGSTRPAAAQRL